MNFSEFVQNSYPAIHRFIIEDTGRIEIGPSEISDAFVGAYDLSGTVYEGLSEYDSLDDALIDLNAGIQSFYERLGI